jgi:hypothetical protein
MAAIRRIKPMYLTRLSLAGSVPLLCLGATTCEAGGRGDIQPPSSTISLEWKFEASSSEEDLVARLVHSLEQEPLHPQPNSTAVLRRFDLAGNPGTYLLMGFLAPEQEGGARPVAIFVLRDAAGTSEISSPFMIGHDVLGTFGIAGTGDFDNDGQPDVVYCQWEDREDAKAVSHVVSYTGTEWIRIPRPTKSVPACED